jgi:hypothetical protein
MIDRPDTRPEIEPYFWDNTNLEWPVSDKTKPDLIIFDPPDYKGQSNNDDRDGISGLSKEKYLIFLEDFFALAHRNTKKTTRLASILSDWPPARRAYASESAISRTPRPWMKNLKNRS